MASMGERERYMLTIGIIVGSTRPGRKAEALARWVLECASKRSDAAFTPASMHERSMTAMLDQAVAWSGALKPLRS